MVAAYDNLTDELQQSKIRLVHELLISPERYKDEYYVHIEVPSTSRFYRISYPEYVFFSQLDGETSYAKAFAVTAQHLGPDAISDPQASQFVIWLLENGLATLEGGQNYFNRSKAHEPHWFQKINPFWIKLPLGNPTSLLEWLNPKLNWAFNPMVMGLSFVFIIISIITGFLNWDEIYQSSRSIFSPENFFSAVVAWVILKVLHELAHAIVCFRNGGFVRETGLIFVLFAPMAYVDVTSSWRFKSRWKRMAVAAAGMYVELLIASCCLVSWFVFSSPIIKQQLVNIILMAGITTVLFNANPLMRFDGYYLLSDFFKVPNLYANGATEFGNHMRWLFLGLAPARNSVELRNHATFITVYGYLAAFWKVVVCVGLAIAAATLLHGLGMVLAVFGVTGWFLKPAKSIADTLLYSHKSRPFALCRAFAVSVAFSGLGAAGWFFVPNPFVAQCPCIVDYQDGSKLRAEISGFITKILVEDGQPVEKGDPILTLANFELESRLAELRADVEIHATEERIAIEKGDATAAQIALADFNADKKLFEALSQEVRNMTICATHKGKISIPRSNERVGTFVEKGQYLATVVKDSSKIVRLMVSPEHIDVTPELMNRPIALSFGSRPRLHAEIVRINPRASRTVDQEKLAAINGGPLVVRESTDSNSQNESLKLATPHFQAIARLQQTESRSLFAGERGYAVLQSNSKTLGGFVFESVGDWIETQFEQSQAF